MSLHDASDDDNDFSALERVPTEDYFMTDTDDCDSTSIGATDPVSQLGDLDALVLSEIDVCRTFPGVEDFDWAESERRMKMRLRSLVDVDHSAVLCFTLPASYPVEIPSVAVLHVDEDQGPADRLHLQRVLQLRLQELCNAAAVSSGPISTSLIAAQRVLDAVDVPAHPTLWADVPCVQYMPAQLQYGPLPKTPYPEHQQRRRFDHTWSLNSISEALLKFATKEVAMSTSMCVSGARTITTPSVLKNFVEEWANMYETATDEQRAYMHEPRPAYHGTPRRDVLDSIAENGMLAPGEMLYGQSLPVAHGQAYGEGAYVSPTLELSQFYAHTTGDGDVIVVVCLAAMGIARDVSVPCRRHENKSSKTTDNDCMCFRCHRHLGGYHSNHNRSDVFVLYSGCQILPVLEVTCSVRGGTDDPFPVTPQRTVFRARDPNKKPARPPPRDRLMTEAEFRLGVCATPLPAFEALHVLEFDAALAESSAATTRESCVYVVDWSTSAARDLVVGCLNELRRLNPHDGSIEETILLCGRTFETLMPTQMHAMGTVTADRLEQTVAYASRTKILSGAMQALGIITQARENAKATANEHVLDSIQSETTEHSALLERDSVHDVDPSLADSTQSLLNSMKRSYLRRRRTLQHHVSLYLVVCGNDNLEEEYRRRLLEHMSTVRSNAEVAITVKVLVLGTNTGAAQIPMQIKLQMQSSSAWEHFPFYAVNSATSIPRVLGPLLKEIKLERERRGVRVTVPRNERLLASEGFCQSLVHRPTTSTTVSLPLVARGRVAVLWRGHVPQALSIDGNEVAVYHNDQYPKREVVEVLTPSNGWVSCLAVLNGFSGQLHAELLKAMRETPDTDGTAIGPYTFTWKDYGRAKKITARRTSESTNGVVFLCRKATRTSCEFTVAQTMSLLQRLCLDLKQHIVTDTDDSAVKTAAADISKCLESLKKGTADEELLRCATPNERVDLVRHYRRVLNDMDMVMNEVVDLLNYRREALSIDRRMTWVVRSSKMKFGARALRRADAVVSETEDEVMRSMMQEMREFLSYYDSEERKNRESGAPPTPGSWSSLHSGLDGAQSVAAMEPVVRSIEVSLRNKNNKNVSLSDLIYTCGMPGLMCRVRRQECSIVNPWTVVVEYVSSTFTDTASSLVAVELQMPMFDAQREACSDALVLVDPQQASLYHRFMKLKLYQSYLATVFTRNPLLVVPGQHTALLIVALVQACLQLLELARDPKRKGDDTLWRQNVVATLRIADSLKTMNYGSVSFGNIIKCLFKPNPGLYFTEAPDNDITTVCKVLVCLACGGDAVRRLFVDDSLTDQRAAVAMSLLGEATSRGCRSQIRKHPSYKPGGGKDVAHAIVTRALRISEDSVMCPTPDEEPDHDEATLVHSTAYDLEAGLRVSGAFFVKTWTNCSPQAVVACLGLAECLAQYPGPNSAADDIIVTEVTRRFRSQDISMRSFLPRYHPGTDPRLLQVALYVQGIVHHDSASRRGGLEGLDDPNAVLCLEASAARKVIYKQRLFDKRSRLNAQGKEHRRRARLETELEAQRAFLEAHVGCPKLFTEDEVRTINATRPATDQLELEPNGLLRHHCTFVSCPQYLTNMATAKDVVTGSRHGLFTHIKYFVYPLRYYVPGLHNAVIRLLRNADVRRVSDDAALVERVLKIVRVESSESRREVEQYVPLIRNSILELWKEQE
eukprot:PhM_4_TR10093/c0_g1_i2/m.19692